MHPTSNKPPEITRFAPSPTGFLHLGHAYAAWVAWEEARKSGGEFLLRIENIDGPRCRVEFEKSIEEDLEWLGIHWPVPIWRQSERMAIYKSALKRLNDMGILYPCFCTRQEIALAAPHGPAGKLYSGHCRRLSLEAGQDLIAADKAFAWRLDVTKAMKLTGPLTWTDTRRGSVVATPELLGDVVLARKDIATSYHLAVTVDDAAQEVSLVTRGEDLFSCTHVHRLLQALLDMPVPRWLHHRLICDENGNRLAKRDDARSLQCLRQAGWKAAQVLEMIIN